MLKETVKKIAHFLFRCPKNEFFCTSAELMELYRMYPDFIPGRVNCSAEELNAQFDALKQFLETPLMKTGKNRK